MAVVCMPRALRLLTPSPGPPAAPLPLPVLGYVTVRSGSEPGAPRRPDGSTLMRLDVVLAAGGTTGGGGGAAVGRGGMGSGGQGPYLAMPRALGHSHSGPSPLTQASALQALWCRWKTLSYKLRSRQELSFVPPSSTVTFGTRRATRRQT